MNNNQNYLSNVIMPMLRRITPELIFGSSIRGSNKYILWNRLDQFISLTVPNSRLNEADELFDLISDCSSASEAWMKIEIAGDVRVKVCDFNFIKFTQWTVTRECINFMFRGLETDEEIY